MEIIPKDTVKEIADQLDCGSRAFYHKETGKTIFVPTENDLDHYDNTEPWEEELRELKVNAESYYEIEVWSTREGFIIMADFAEQLSDNLQLKNKLFAALKKRKPFREFKFLIDNSGVYREQWFAFKNQWQQDYVDKSLKRMKAVQDENLDNGEI
jgi:hypothetical protein